MSVISYESVDIGSILDGLGEIYFFAVSNSSPVPAKMPFADHLSVIARPFKKVSYRFPSSRDKMITGSNQNSTG